MDTNRLRKLLRSEWVAWVGGLAWEQSITATFDPSLVFPVNEFLASKEAQEFCHLIERIARRQVAWLVSPERGSSGQWHAHVLLASAPQGAIFVATEYWKARNGRVHIADVFDNEGIVTYVTKQAALAGRISFSGTALEKRVRADSLAP